MSRASSGRINFLVPPADSPAHAGQLGRGQRRLDAFGDDERDARPRLAQSHRTARGAPEHRLLRVDISLAGPVAAEERPVNADHLAVDAVDAGHHRRQIDAARMGSTAASAESMVELS
jgi:hypothetical protein